MNIRPLRLPGLLVVEPRVFRDERGYFFEVWNRERFAAAGLPERFEQDNLSYSTAGVLRGLHYQYPTAQGKFLTVLRGEIFDVAVDIRLGSPTFGQWEGITLSAENGRQLYIPEGFAHGFAVTGPEALLLYQCTAPYDPRSEGIVLWNDPDLGIAWPLHAPILAAKDRAAPKLQAIPAERLPRFEWQAGGG
ncbi:MAG: dTDP-4-dehydrorhamnose 3,5-epimerase [Isosphaeraceae bacterium]|nr:dTDP-4-dehydrorhamnose 3,5-epimerase [Isosphaeraceae bacterium]